MARVRAAMEAALETVLPEVTRLLAKWGLKFKSKEGLCAVTGRRSRQTSSPREAHVPLFKGGNSHPF